MEAHRVSLFAMADLDKLKTCMKDFQEKILAGHFSTCSIEESRTWFTDTLDACVDECIPAKLISKKP